MSIRDDVDGSYRVECEAWWDASAHGCSGLGRAGRDRTDASALAREDGWGCNTWSDTWWCPSHAETKEQG